MKKIMLSQVENFVRHQLKLQLRPDLRNVWLLREPDVACSAYNYLRRFLKGDTRWRVFASKYSRATGHYHDLMIYRYRKPRIAVEIKWRKPEISHKDRKGLRRARNKLKVKKTYFLCVVPDSGAYKRANKREGEKYRLFEVIVDLGYKSRQKIAEWKMRRKEFRG